MNTESSKADVSDKGYFCIYRLGGILIDVGFLPAFSVHYGINETPWHKMAQMGLRGTKWHKWDSVAQSGTNETPWHKMAQSGTGVTFDSVL